MDYDGLDVDGMCPPTSGTFPPLPSRPFRPRSHSCVASPPSRSARYPTDERLLRFRTGAPPEEDQGAVNGLLPTFNAPGGGGGGGGGGGYNGYPAVTPNLHFIHRQQQHPEGAGTTGAAWGGHGYQGPAPEEELAAAAAAAAAVPTSSLPAHVQRLVVAQQMLTVQNQHLQIMRQRHDQLAGAYTRPLFSSN